MDRQVTLLIISIFLGGFGVSGAEGDAPIRIDADFAGGNIVLKRTEGSILFVAPDLRDTQTNQWWFYWNFRVHAATGTPITVVFADQNPIGVRGPAMSTDGGATWKWGGSHLVRSFQHDGKPAWSFPASGLGGTNDVRYAFCPQYLESHLRKWIERHQADPALRVEELCRSRKGRVVELLRAGCLDRAKSRGVVLVTSRHHCCETMATYVMEGLLEAVLADDALGQRWRDNWEVLAVPFMDKDGVEDGDQGKNRTPHDHNRDYNARPLYPEVAALMKLGQSMPSRVVASLDLHCPWIRGEWNDRVYMVGSLDPVVWRGQTNFAAVLEREQTGPIHFRARDCLAYGTAWNTSANTTQGRASSGWARDAFPSARLVTTIEIAYADALGVEVTADSARALGRDLAASLAAILPATSAVK